MEKVSKEIIKIALDAGHGATEQHQYTGAAANGLVEDTLASEMTQRIGHQLRKRGLETVFTRPTRESVPFTRRVKTAINENCRALISIHFNAGVQTANGIEAYCAENDMYSFELAGCLMLTLAKSTFKIRGIKWDSQSRHRKLKLLRELKGKMPAVLLELGFLTNKGDAEKLRDKNNLEMLANLVASAVSFYCKIGTKIK